MHSPTANERAYYPLATLLLLHCCRSAMELVQLLLPFFVTLEEVGGFVHTK